MINADKRGSSISKSTTYLALINIRLVQKIMINKSVIRNLVNRALLVKRLTPELENMINHELSAQGYITDPDYEALEYLMQAIDQGKVRQVS
jgi:hypothetical protein